MSAILIIDDEANIRRMLGRLLESEGHVVDEAGDAGTALAAVARSEPDAILLDLVIPGTNDLDLLRELRRDRPAVPIIMMSGRASLSQAVQATKLGAFHFLEKPLKPEAVLLTVTGALELRRARDLSRALTEELGVAWELVGSSQALRQTRDVLERVAGSEARVLLLGESGTGKELAAAAIHRASARAAGPFVRVNSAAIPRDLVESEMFGHEQGAFTGAVERRRGRFELAHGGTLFLDEVADLRPEAQAKLLRALESGEIERVGGQRAIHVDVRVIAATNRDLRAEVERGDFREDLFYRLHVVPIRMPPLRERLEDVPELVTHFFHRLHARDGLAPPALEPRALARLSSYDWPGNVRELLNICERLAILHSGQRVGERDVARLLAGADPDAAVATSLSERLDAHERRLLEAALRAAGGSVTDAARQLRTDRANLYRRMKRLGIRP